MASSPSRHSKALLESLEPRIPSVDRGSPPAQSGEVSLFQRPVPLVDLRGEMPVEDEEDLTCVAQLCSSFDNQDMLLSEELEDAAGSQQGATRSADSEILKRRDSQSDSPVKQQSHDVKPDHRFPAFPFSLLDQWDLDAVIQSLGLATQGCASYRHEADAVERGSTQDDIMEKLTALCKQQSLQFTSQPAVQSELAPSPADIRMAAEFRPSRRERPTVYIDLRRPDPSVRTAGTHRGAWAGGEAAANPAGAHGAGQRGHKGRGRPGSLMEDGEETCKSMLLRKLREMKNRGDEARESRRPGDSSDSRRPFVPGRRQESWVSEADEPSSAPRTKAAGTSTCQRTRPASDLQHGRQVLRTLQRGQQQQILEDLETVAEKGDSLYDFESSYLAPGGARLADLEEVLLVVSPAVAPRCYSHVLAVCDRRGLGLKGARRLPLDAESAKTLGLGGRRVEGLPFGGAPSSGTLDRGEVEPPSHGLVLLLRTENVLRHCAALLAALMREFEAQGLLGSVASSREGGGALDPSSYFHILPYTERLHNTFGRNMWVVPAPPSVFLSGVRFPPGPEAEQLVILSLCGNHLSPGLSLLHRVLEVAPEGDGAHDGGGFELLGLKWLPALSRLQAQELSPYEVGERLWQSDLRRLASQPALVCALRRPDAIAALRRLLPPDRAAHPHVLVSPTPGVARRQASAFFFEDEMTHGGCVAAPGV